MQQGDTGVVANVVVANNGSPVPIEIAGTTIEIRDALDAVVLVNNLTRIDALDTLQSISNNVLSYRFDIPADFIGEYSIFGLLKPEGLPQLRSSSSLATFTVFSGSNISYIDSSLVPATAVPAENVVFNVALFDSGTAALTLLPDSTWLQFDFSPSAGTVRTYLGGNFALTANDTTQVSFDLLDIPAYGNTG